MTSTLLEDGYASLRRAVAGRDDSVLPQVEALGAATTALPQPSDPDYLSGRGAPATIHHLHSDIVPALNSQALSARYYGFVTGGCLPVAEAADNVVSALDQNVQVSLPNHSASVAVEDAALRMLLALLGLGPADQWPARTFTTGATASNVLGLACGREAIVAERLPRGSPATVAEVGLLTACAAAGVREIQVLTSMGHSSLSKAASIVGLGHRSIRSLPLSEEEPWRLDLDALERELAREETASIVAVSAGEVNTGRFATSGLADMKMLRSLVDRYGAWLHVDGAFGIFARALPKSDDFSKLHEYAAGLELADSITADGHKLLNVPYDTGIFLARHASIVTQVCRNPGAAYLPSADGARIPSPLNNGLENSRRFRGLPVYAVLLSEGREGMAAMLARMVVLARGIAAFIRDSEHYEWLPRQDADLKDTHIIVLFRARDEALNRRLVESINETGKMYVSGTTWRGEKACRIAVSSWRVDVARDLAVVRQVLALVARESRE